MLQHGVLGVIVFGPRTCIGRFINGLTVEARATKWTAERRVSSFAGKPGWGSFLWRSEFNRIFLAVVTG